MSQIIRRSIATGTAVAVFALLAVTSATEAAAVPSAGPSSFRQGPAATADNSIHPNIKSPDVWFYTDANYSGDQADAGTQSPNFGGFNDRVSSIIIYNDLQSFCFYVDANYSGASFMSPSDTSGNRYYPDLSIPNPFWNDALSSFRPALLGSC
ncbi:peptidase inhibitor family I36 protein [Actinacidiphila guanduensis]|uniref:Peptidase inhibitor family I36 n=1 Tax=Actinacidiphila guanduensis TaxID=310781 RepID=A0A1H0S4E6_9ACTN|nr:peptidase inhibitor family I36 protein [Actinacidiphila guanduensis]SDP36537.1 Peptidase inhibitor family I36 [Actinacidiphila guanduensis]